MTQQVNEELNKHAGRRVALRMTRCAAAVAAVMAVMVANQA
jgi:hypothetical protein